MEVRHGPSMEESGGQSGRGMEAWNGVPVPPDAYINITITLAGNRHLMAAPTTGPRSACIDTIITHSKSPRTLFILNHTPDMFLIKITTSCKATVVI